MQTTLTAAFVAALATATGVQAATILAVDFGQTGSPLETTPSPGGAAWQAFSATQNNGTPSEFDPQRVFATSAGNITIKLDTNSGTPGRLRNGPADNASFNYGSLLIDLVTGLVEGSDKATVTISGLQPNTQYDLRLWSQDNQFNDDAALAWYDSTTPSSPALIGTITNQAPATAADLTSDLAFSVAGRVTADGNGFVRLGHTDSKGTGVINGLELSTVPEPAATTALLALGALATRRRRH